MMKNKALLMLVVLLMGVILVFTSCGGTGNGGEQGGEGSGEQGGGEGGSGNEGGENEEEGGGSKDDAEPEIGVGETLYYKKSDIAFYYSGEKYSQKMAEDLLAEINSNIAKSGRLFVGNAAKDNYQNEVTVGYVPEKSASKEAYRQMNALPKTSDISDVRYLIYADSGKIAIAYELNKLTSYQPIFDVVAGLVEEYIRGKSQLFFEKGVITYGTVNLIDGQKQLDDAENAEKWDALSEKLGNEDIYLSLRNMIETMFSDEIIDLVASYYDPASGLFYSSGSGKNAEGIYPNPEATSQALTYMSTTGMMQSTTGQYAISELQKYKIIYYLKSIQDKSGEFYVSQMPMSDVDSNRMGRDRTACTGLLNRLGGKPTYDVGAYKGDGITADEYWANLVENGMATEEDKPHIYWAEPGRAGLEAELKSPVTAAVSKAVLASDAVAAASGTEPFQSHEAFVKWLLAKDPYNNPYSAMSNTSSAAAIISDWDKILGGYSGNTTISYNGKTFDIHDGDTLYDILINWVNDNVNEAGLFGKMTNNYVKDANGKYVYRNGEYVLAEDGKGEYSPDYDGFFGGWGYQNSNGFLKAIGRYSDAGVAFPKPREAAESLLKGINSDETAEGNILVIYNVWSSLNNLKSNIKTYYEGTDKEELLEYIDSSLTGKTDILTGETLDKAYAAVAIDKCLSKVMEFKKSDGGFGHSTTQGTATWQGGMKVGVASDNLSDLDAINCSTSLLGRALCSVFGINMTKEVPVYTGSDLFRFLNVLNSQECVIKDGPTPVGGNQNTPVSEVETFDVMPSYVSISLKSGSNAEIAELGDNKALLINKGEGFGSINFNVVGKKESDANAVVIRFDMMIKELTAWSGIEPYVQSGKTQIFLPYLQLTGGNEGDDIKVYDHKSGNSAVPSGAKIGSWSSFAIKYYPELERYDLYVDGKYVISGSYLRNGADEYPSVTDIDCLYFGLASANVGKLYFDNISIQYLKLEIPTGTPGEDGGSTETPGGSGVKKTTFDDGVLPGYVTVSSANPANTYTVVDKGDGKMLYLSKTEAGKSISVSYNNVVSEANANVTEYGLDLLVENIASDKGGIELYATKSGRKTYLVYLLVEDGVIKFRHNAKGEKYEVGRVGENIRVVFKYRASSQSYDLYVNGEMIGTFTGTFNDAAVPGAGELTELIVFVSSDCVGDYYIDNVYFAQIKE